MDLSKIARKLALSNPKHVIQKAEELRRLSNVNFNSSIIGVGEVKKAIIFLEIATTRLQLLFNRQNVVKLSGMSKKAYNRSFNAMQNGMGINYKEQFLDALPGSRRANADFGWPVFTITALYLCAKRHKLKVDKFKLIELCGTGI